ncbi:hypothetical protein CRG98_046570 [Punica granatum]|uniref:Uncharacterized protein n=1 Tax=Punica granatum TaxID=22663 RepID=A0A2I0HMW7_PUNGR|nr:hypothetical protein CRG98_046570 [Punica granatum]
MAAASCSLPEVASPFRSSNWFSDGAELLLVVVRVGLVSSWVHYRPIRPSVKVGTIYTSPLVY